MRTILMGAALLALAGCSMIPLLGGDVTIGYSSIEAKQLSGCAVGVEVFTKKSSLQTIPGLIRGDAATLGNTAEEGMKKCLKLLQALEDAP